MPGRRAALAGPVLGLPGLARRAAQAQVGPDGAVTILPANRSAASRPPNGS